MELDGYCPDLQLAFEYQGEQHYLANSYFNRLRGGFKELLQRDRLKAQQCEAKFEMTARRSMWPLCPSCHRMPISGIV